MATAPPPKSPLLPPDEKFWKRYSPHFELPLAGAMSLLLHGAVFGVLALGGLAYLLQGQVDARKPVEMEAVTMNGTGDGLPPGGDGTPGEGGPGGPPRTEMTAPDAASAKPPPNAPMPVAPDIAVTIPEIPTLPVEPSDNAVVLEELEKVAADADRQVKQAMEIDVKRHAAAAKPTAPSKTAPPASRGVGKPGVNGPGGGGTGGPGNGPGTGVGGPPGGRKATRQEVYAWRWRFELGGGGKEHADKLAAIGVTLAFPDPFGGYLVINDLSRRPAELRKDSLKAYQEAVKWFNTGPASLQQLAQELRLPFVPKYVVLLLPKDREEKMAAEEQRFAQQQGRDLQRVRETWFDFRRGPDGYEPHVVRQQ